MSTFAGEGHICSSLTGSGHATTSAPIRRISNLHLTECSKINDALTHPNLEMNRCSIRAATELKHRVGRVGAVDRVCDLPEYNLRSKHRLGARDAIPAFSWLRPGHPIADAFLRLFRQKLPTRKEFYESLFAIDRLEPELSRAKVLYEIGAGHGMFGIFAALVFPNIERVYALDQNIPPSRDGILERLAVDHPWLKTKARVIEAPLGGVLPPPDALLVGIHACGALTDGLAEMAQRVRAPFAVVPCCEERTQLPKELRDSVPSEAIADSVNALRLERWRSWDYALEERALPARVTGRNRVFVAAPRQTAAGAVQPASRS